MLTFQKVSRLSQVIIDLLPWHQSMPIQWKVIKNLFLKKELNNGNTMNASQSQFTENQSSQSDCCLYVYWFIENIHTDSYKAVETGTKKPP